MQYEELKQNLKTLNVTLKSFCEMVGIEYSSGKNYSKKERGVPQNVTHIINLMLYINQTEKDMTLEKWKKIIQRNNDG